MLNNIINLAFAMLIILLSISCQKQNQNLSVDEITFSEYRVGLFPSPFKFILHNDGTVTKIKYDVNDFIENDLKRFIPYYVSPSPRWYFVPFQILKISSNGSIKYFCHQRLDSLKQGSYEFSLSQNSIKYFNSLLDSINLNNVDSMYEEKSGGILYHGSYYYLSFRINDRNTFTHIYYLNDSSSKIKRFVEFLKYFISKSKFNFIERSILLEKEFKQIIDSDLNTKRYE